MHFSDAYIWQQTGYRFGYINSPPRGQNDRHSTDDIFGSISLNEKYYIVIKISLKSVPKGAIDNNPALV